MTSKPVSKRHELMLIEAATREEEFGWVFFYNSRRYLETKDTSWMVLGCSPIIVNRFTGEVHATGSSRPLQAYIEDYRQMLSSKGS